MQINCWEFKTRAQKYMSYTCLAISSLPQEAHVAINWHNLKSSWYFIHTNIKQQNYLIMIIKTKQNFGSLFILVLWSKEKI